MMIRMILLTTTMMIMIILLMIMMIILMIMLFMTPALRMMLVMMIIYNDEDNDSDEDEDNDGGGTSDLKADLEDREEREVADVLAEDLGEGQETDVVMLGHGRGGVEVGDDREVVDDDCGLGGRVKESDDRSWRSMFTEYFNRLPVELRSTDMSRRKRKRDLESSVKREVPAFV